MSFHVIFLWQEQWAIFSRLVLSVFELASGIRRDKQEPVRLACVGFKIGNPAVRGELYISGSVGASSPDL